MKARPAIPTAALHALLLALLIAAAYANSLNCDFVLDSGAIIVDDPRIKTLDYHSLYYIFTENYWWPTQQSDLYRPLTTLSFLLNTILTPKPLNPLWFHLVNLLIHFGNALLIAALTRQFMAPLSALMVAGIFAVHPQGVESVTNLVGRADLLATFTLLAGLLCHVKFSDGGGKRWLLLTGLVGAIGVFCKESAVMLIGLMLAWDFCFATRQRVMERNWKSYATLIPSWIMLWAARRAILGATPIFTQIGVDNPLVMADPVTRVLTALSIQGRYLGQFFWPHRLSCDYSFDQIWMVGESWESAAWLGAFIAAAIGVIWLGRRNRAILFLALAALLVMLPTSNLLFLIGTIMAERFMYLPVAMLAAIGILSLQPLLSRWAMVPVMGTLILAALAIRTCNRNVDWKSELSLWQSAQRVCPGSFKVYQGQASALWQRDGLEKAAPAMIELLDQSCRIIQTDRLPLIHRPMTTYSILAQALLQKGLDSPPGVDRAYFEKGLEASRAGIAIDAAYNQASRQARLKRGIPPEKIFDVGFYHLHINHAALLGRIGKMEEAVAAIDYARHLSPGKAQGHLRAADILQAMDRLDLAAERAWQGLLCGDVPTAMMMLERIYARLSPQEPIVTRTATGYATNKQHRLVAEHVDKALGDLTRLCITSGAPDVARPILNIAKRELGRPVDQWLGQLDNPPPPSIR